MPQHEYLNNSLLSKLIDNSCKDRGKDGSDDLLVECLMDSAVDHGYKPAPFGCLKFEFII